MPRRSLYFIWGLTVLTVLSLCHAMHDNAMTVRSLFHVDIVDRVSYLRDYR